MRQFLIEGKEKFLYRVRKNGVLFSVLTVMEKFRETFLEGIWMNGNSNGDIALFFYHSHSFSFCYRRPTHVFMRSKSREKVFEE